jgi:hypothetical protein
VKEMNAGHGPVVAVIRNPWDVYEARRDPSKFVRPMLVTADGMMWERGGGRWKPMGRNITESIDCIKNEETTP